ncbi:unnamed protein product, partial [Phaeothamnion confervicola]
MLVSAISLICSVAVMALFASRKGEGLHMAYAHMGVAALVAIGFAAVFMRANNRLRASGASQSAVAATTSKFVGYVAAWAAVCLLSVYGTGLIRWREWLTFTIACAVISALGLLFATMLQRDADAGKDDAGMLKIANGMAVALLAGMVITIVGLIIDGKMVRFLKPEHGDWAANNVFFFSAIALAAIAGYALKQKR